MSSDTRRITIEDLYQFKFVAKPRISPDGQRVAFVVTTIDERTYEYRSSIWMVPTAGGEAKRFTYGPDNAHSPSWSPDGRWLAFVSERKGETADKSEKEQKKPGKDKPQIWLIPTDGGEAHQLTFMQHGASNPVWSPDSKQLLFNAEVGPVDEETEDGKPLPKARVIDRLWYRLDGVGFIYERRNHLFLADINGGEPQQLTDGDWDDSDPAWSPDGSRIAFVSSRGEDRWRIPAPDVYTLAIENGKAGTLQCLTDGSLSSGSPSWSPDGQTIAFLAALKLRSGGHVDIYTIASNAQQSAATCLTSEFEGSFQDWTNSDMGDEHLSPAPVWSSDGKRLYELASHHGATRIFAISTNGAGTQPPTLTPGEVHVRDFSADKSADKLAMLVGSPTKAPEIYVRSTASDGELQRLTGFNDSLFNSLVLSRPEHMPYTGAEGWPMDGWILKPHDFDSSKKYPLIVEIHGGPATQYGYGFFHEMQMLVAAGYVVLYTNPRGSIGYGRDFSLAVRGAWGEKDSLDIMAGVDALLQKGYIDEQRLGVTGGSYGGFMTNWLIGHTDRFKAAVTQRSVVNLASDFGSSDFGWAFADDELETTPWDNLDAYMHMSPIKYVKQMRTPLLILHSEQDLRCNVEQAEQLFAALKYLGREVLFVRFEGQSHGLSRGGHPKLRVERLKHIIGWFEKYLK
ncbi:MAG TPA: S9 family peptidase [Ktedonobacteraceae bacterium]